MIFETIDIFIVNDNSSKQELLDVISSYPNIKIVGEADNAELAIQKLNDLLKREIKIDLIILLCRDRASFIAGESGVESYQKLIAIAPSLPIFILSSNNCSSQFIKIVAGFEAKKNGSLKFDKTPSLSQNLGKIVKKNLAYNARSGLKQIKENLDIVNKKLEQIQTNLDERIEKNFKKDSSVFFDLLFWQGRRRELLVTKLLIEKIANTLLVRFQKRELVSSIDDLIAKKENPIAGSKLTNDEGGFDKTNLENNEQKKSDLATISPTGEREEKQFNCQLFNKISNKVQLGLRNSTGLLLEIDILKKQQKIDLFQKILKQLDRLYLEEKTHQAELTEKQRESQNQADVNLEIDVLNNEGKINLFQRIFPQKQLETVDLEAEETNGAALTEKQVESKDKADSKNNIVLVDRNNESIAIAPSILENRNLLLEIWEESTEEFLKNCLEQSSEIYDISAIIEEESENVSEEILNKIPLFNEAFAWLVSEEKKPEFILEKTTKKEIETSDEIAGEKAVEIVIQNSIVKIANATIVVILNNFIRVESVEKNLYKSSLISSREMARMRNNLSWRYRKEKYFEEPRNIFESQYRLFYFNGNKIYAGWFYNPRYEDLNQLRGIPWLTTIALETRDALAPILQAVVGFVGEAIFYLLKDVIGKGIGLIGQGIIQGVGNALQDNRYSKKNKRKK